jgi:5-methylcytosine-specific restriction protein B
MKPQFWKLSQGGTDFVYQDVLDSIARGLVYVHKDTKALGTSTKTQGQDFVDAQVGDYFYLTHGNKGVFLLGQFSGPANLFCSKGDGWLDRPFRLIRPSVTNKKYDGKDKWWAPNHNSTFVRVPDGELALFEECILQPYFGIKLADFRIPV